MKRLSCESCGADLPAPDAKGYSRCPACGQTSQVEQPTPPPAPRPAVAAPRPVVINLQRGSAAAASKAVTRTGRVLAVGVVLSIVITVIVIAVVVVSVSKGVGPLSGKKSKNIITLGGSFIPINQPGVAPKLGTDDATNSVAVIQEYTDSAHRYLTRFTVGNDAITERWRSPDLPKDAYNLTATRVGKTVFVAAVDQVWALDEATGKRRWVADLDDEVPNRCSECFVGVGGQLVVRTKDSQLSGYSPESAEPRWKLRLDSPSATVTASAGRLFVLDDKVNGDEAAVRTVDPATGQTTATFTPSCPDPNFPGERTARGTGNHVFAIDGSTDLAMIFAGSGGCVVRWDPASGAVRYANGLGEVFSIDQDDVLAAGNDLVFPNESGLLAHVDLTTGQVAPLDPIADVDVKPDRVIGDTLIALTTTTRGSTRGGVAAWNLRTGKILWQVQSPDNAQATSDSSDALFEGTARSVLLSSNNGLRLMVFGSDRKVTTYGIDLASGALKTGKPKDVSVRTSGTPSLTVEAVEPTRVIVTIDSLLESIPAGSGDIVTYPASD